MGVFTLSIMYFLFYTVTGVLLKYFTDGKIPGLPHMSQMGFLYNSTAGGVLTACLIVALFRWWKLFRSRGEVSVLGVRFPREYLWIFPSGVCTGIIIPTTTLMYTFGSVMVAMILMRGSVIVIGRVVDAVQIRQGILQRRVPWEENVAVIFAIFAVLSVLLGPKKGDESALFRSVPAVVTLIAYLLSYLVRIYIMNHYRHTRQENDNRPFFTMEQAVAATTVITVAVFVVLSYQHFGWTDKRILDTVNAAYVPTHNAFLAGIPYGAVAFFSVFIFMYPGKTATFNTLANRLTSLVAGTTATLLFYLGWGGRLPSTADWISLTFILIAIGFLVKGDFRMRSSRH